MVRIRDEGSEFDAPIDVVWRFLRTPEVHLPAHTGERELRVEALHENAFLSRSEVRVGDRWVPLTNRVTLFPPVASVIETVRGPGSGSVLVHLYTPSGPRTRVDVYGDFVLPGVPDPEAQEMAARSLATLFEAHNEALRKFAAGP